jgi:flavin-dependent dehydrogenase
LHVLQVFVPHDEHEWIGSLLSNPETSLKSLFSWLAPELESYVQASKFEGPVRALMRFPNNRHRGVGPGWALVGDALCFKDPALGQGIHDAIESSRILSSILARLSDWRGSFEEIRREYEGKFYNKIASRFDSALSVSRAEILTEDQAYRFSRIACDPEATKRYLGFLNYRYSAEDVEETLRSAVSYRPPSRLHSNAIYGMKRGLCSPMRTS